MRFRSSILAFLLALWVVPAMAQVAPTLPNGGTASSGSSAYMSQPTPYTIGSIEVEGVQESSVRQFVLRTSGLQEGQRILLPGAEAIAQAVRSIYEARMFSDVEIRQASRQGQTVNLVIEVTPEPRLNSYRFTGIRDRHRDDLEEKVPLLRGSPVRPGQVERTSQVIKEFYKEKGYLRTTVDVEREMTENNRVDLTFRVDRKEKVEVENIVFEGNEVFDDGNLRGAMKETKENRWWRFWKGETFKENKYEEDLQKVVQYYNERGYYDARIVRDSVYLSSSDGLTVEIEVQEGEKYHIRDIEWDGNTVYTDRVLTNALGLSEGDVYNGNKLEQNLRGNKQSTDVSSLYLDRGYMQFDVRPQVRVVGEDSLDLNFEVREGEVYDFGEITITGNDKTKEHVIRRELYTVPGETFSRSAIRESIRRLMQLSYFSQESLAQGPSVNVNDEEQEVDLTYSVKEVGSDQLELSGTWGRYGLVLQLGFKFNNFSAQNLFNGEAWRPLPTGDGQKLSMNVRTNGRYYQSYSLSFTEPWFRGRPTPVGGSISYSRFSRAPFRSIVGDRSSDGTFTRLSSSLFYERRLQWPDDKFSTSSSVGYQYYNNENRLVGGLPPGVSQQVTFQQALIRNSLDNPMFPSRGSKVRFSVEVAPPLSDNLVQYHKWRFKMNWNLPLTNKLSIGVSTDYGYIGSITGEAVRFQRFNLGGSAFDYSGFNYGTEPVFMRGYPARTLGPRLNGEAIGGRILNKYTSELRFMAVQNQQLRAQPYLFLDAANSWDGVDTFNPARLYRSTGIGVKVFLPIVGMLEFNYGYNFDAFDPVESGQTGEPGWRFQFSLGQGFGQ